MNYIELLQAELRPAFGCTEPIALAYAAAKSVAVLGECPTSMTARCSANIIKNVKSVTIPNSGGRKGLACAAILGVIPCLEQQITYNTAISAEGMGNNYGSNIGQLLLLDESNPSLELLCKARAAAGSDARMSGCPLPVVICSGSGNQGLTVSMPIITAAEQLGKSQEELYRALAFGNLLTLYIKSGIGKLSAYCGVVSAGVAGVAAVAFLKGDSQQIIEDTVSNGLANTSGIVCDGAKPSCAGKIAIAIDSGFMSYKQARLRKSYEKGDGIVCNSVDETIKSIGVIAREGMKQTDVVILNEMLKH